MTKKSRRKKKTVKKAHTKKKLESDKDNINKSIFQNIKPWHIILVLLAIIVVYILAGKQPAAVTNGDQVAVDFYVMSQCPYGTQVEDAIAPVMEQMGDAVDLNIYYIVQEVAPGQFTSLHGEPEIKGNIVQLCAKQYNPDKHLDFILCQNKNSGAIPNNWESCVDSEGLDKENIRTCYEGDEGKQLLSESAKQTNKVGAGASPTIYIGGEAYNGQRDTLSFQRAICRLIPENSACLEIPACVTDFDCPADSGKVPSCVNPNEKDARCEQSDPVEVDFIILNDKTCSSCDTSQVLSVTKQLFLGAKERVVDVSSSEGQQLVGELGISVVPAFLFNANVRETFGWKNNPRIYSAFEQKGSYMKLTDEASGASHYVDKQARAVFYETVGVEFGDNKPQIDFFVMSYCPYGNQAEEIIESVFDNLGNTADFNPHYVIYSNYQGGGPQFCFDDESKYCSMHGIVELNQNIREWCVDKHLGTQAWFTFVREMNAKCNAQNADTCWIGVADSLAIDKSVVNECFENEAMDMLVEELELNKVLKVSGSPTIFIDGDSYRGARDASAIQAAMCDAFDSKPSECAKSISGAAATAPAAPSGGCGA